MKEMPRVGEYSGWDGPVSSRPTSPSTSLPPPEPEPEPEPSPIPVDEHLLPPQAPEIEDDGLGASGVIAGVNDDLTGITGDYTGLVCEPCSTNWTSAPSQECFSAIQITASSVTGSEATLTNSNGVDAFYALIAENAYANLTIGIDATGGNWGDYRESIPVRLDEGDSINLQIDETGIQFFQLLKDGYEWISDETIATLNSSYPSITVTLTLNSAQYCSPRESESGVDDYVEETDEEESESSDTSSWSQDDSWVLIGGLVLLGIAYYFYITVKPLLGEVLDDGGE